MRRTISNLLASMAGALPDNNTHLITPAILRGVLLDYAESLLTVTSVLTGTPGAPVVQALTAAPVKMAAGVFATALNGNAALIEARVANNDALVKTAVGRILVILSVTWTGPNNQDFAFTLAKNGVALAQKTTDTGRGAGSPITSEFVWVVDNLAVNDFIELFLATVAGAANITISSATIRALLIPQYS